jgi:hypothetical protein
MRVCGDKSGIAYGYHMWCGRLLFGVCNN